MDGVIWVQGFIGDLPSGSTNHIPAGHDDFATEFVAITDIGTISFHNLDTDQNFVALVPDLPAPLNPGEIGIIRIVGADAVHRGCTITINFQHTRYNYSSCANLTY